MRLAPALLAAALPLSAFAGGGIAVDPAAAPPPAPLPIGPSASRLVPEEPPRPLPPAPSRAEMDRLIARLGAEAFQAREDAQRELERLCAACPVAVLKALWKPPEDIEIRVRCEAVRERVVDELTPAWTEGAPADDLAWLLRSGEPSLQIAALEAVRAPVDPGLKPEILALAGSADRFVRLAARKLALESALEIPFAESENPSDRRRALSALAGRKDPHARQRLLAALGDGHPTVRREAVRWLAESPGAEDSIAPLLSDPSPLVQEEAARALRALLKAPWKDESLLEEAQAWQGAREKVPANRK